MARGGAQRAAVTQSNGGAKLRVARAAAAVPAREPLLALDGLWRSVLALATRTDRQAAHTVRRVKRY